jgi:hypothetical protein
MRAKKINEDLPVGLWNDSNLKAVKGWSSATRDKQKYRVTTKEPLDVTLDDDVDLAKLRFIFNKYRIKYAENKNL